MASTLSTHPITSLVLLATAACVTATVPAEIAQTIPRDARAIRLHSDQNPTDHYRTLYRSLVGRGFAIAQENEQMGTLSTEFKDIGQGTTLRLNVFVEPAPGGSVATIRGQWGLTASMAVGLSAGLGASAAGGTPEDANWSSSGRPKAAFGEMAVIANALPHTRIEYLPQ